MWFFLLTSEKSTVGIYWNNAAETWIDIRSTTADKVIRQSSYSERCSESHMLSLKMKACCFVVGLLVDLWDVQSVSWDPLLQSLTMTHRWCSLNYRAKVTWFTDIYVKYCLTNIFKNVKYLTVIRLHTHAGLNYMVSDFKVKMLKVTRLTPSPT